MWTCNTCSAPYEQNFRKFGVPPKNVVQIIHIKLSHYWPHLAISLTQHFETDSSVKILHNQYRQTV